MQQKKVDTKSRILDAAEELFSKHGYYGSSIRAVCSAAGVNVASTHYHFKNKDSLAQAVLARRMEGLSIRRKQLLDDLFPQEKAPSVQSLFATFVLPLIELIQSEGDRGVAYVKTVARLLSERPDLIWIVFTKCNADNFARQTEGFVRALPELPIELIHQRQTMGTAIALHWLANPLQFTKYGPDMADRQTPSELSLQILDFVTAGISSPFASGTDYTVQSNKTGIAPAQTPGSESASTSSHSLKNQFSANS